MSPFDKTITLCCTCLKILNNKKKTYTCKCTYSCGDLEAINMFFHHVATHTKWKENVNLRNFQKQGLHMPSTSKHQPPTNLLKIENITQFPWIMNTENSPCGPIYHETLIDLTLIQKN
jgi:hypothetical protein